MNSDSEWYTLCSKNNILLEHLEDTDDFKITFDVLEKYENIVEIIQDNRIFELLFELNKDVIINYSETINKNISDVILTISSKNLPVLDDKFTEANVYFSYSIKENKELGCTTLYSNVINKPDEKSYNSVYLHNFDLQLTNNHKSSHFIVNYSLNDGSNKVSNKFISLHLKNIFYKLKQYFD